MSNSASFSGSSFPGSEKPRYKQRVEMKTDDVLTLGCDRSKPSAMSHLSYTLEIRPDKDGFAQVSEAHKKKHLGEFARTLPAGSVTLRSIRSSILAREATFQDGGFGILDEERKRMAGRTRSVEQLFPLSFVKM